jgi:hypothetical protein
LQVFALPIFCTCVLFVLQCMARRGGGLPGVWSLQGGPQDAAATAGTVHNEEEIKLAGMHLQSWCDVAVFLFVIADRLWQCCWPWWYYSVWCGATDVVMRRCPSNSQVTVLRSVLIPAVTVCPATTMRRGCKTVPAAAPGGMCGCSSNSGCFKGNSRVIW